MRDVFYTILIIWILWRIVNGVNAYRSKGASNSNPSDQGTMPYKRTHSAKEAKQKMADNEGEYVDYEEVK